MRGHFTHGAYKPLVPPRSSGFEPTPMPMPTHKFIQTAPSLVYMKCRSMRGGYQQSSP